jgi:hypothetical protein
MRRHGGYIGVAYFVLQGKLGAVSEELEEALQRQWEGFKAEHGCYPNELRKPWNLKLWFNQRYPYYRLCFHRWCLRFQTYDHRCEKHQAD